MWKTVSALLSSLILGVSLLPAQGQVREEVVPMSMGDRNALSIVLEDVEEKLVEASWKDFMGRYGKVTKSKGEWVAKQVAIKSIGGSGLLNILVKAKQTGNDVTMSAWFDLGGTFLASSLEPDKYAAAEEFLKEFSFKVSRDSATAKLNAAQTLLKKLESKLNKLQARHRSYENDLRKAENSIAKARQSMRDNLSEQADIQEELKKLTLTVQEAERRLKK
jgi:hypothetical protein